MQPGWLPWVCQKAIIYYACIMGWCSPGWDFFYGAMTKISIFPHCRLACECSLRNRMRRPQSDGNNTATTEPLLYCSYRGDLRPKFWLSTLKPKSSGLLASICRLDGDGEKRPNGLAIDPLGSGSAQVDWRCGSQARYTSNSTFLDMPALCL